MDYGINYTLELYADPSINTTFPYSRDEDSSLDETDAPVEGLTVGTDGECIIEIGNGNVQIKFNLVCVQFNKCCMGRLLHFVKKKVPSLRGHAFSTMGTAWEIDDFVHEQDLPGDNELVAYLTDTREKEE